MREIEDAALAFDRAMDVAGVPYVIVGGIAVMAWGQPRATRNIDTLVALEEGDVERFVEAVEDESFQVDRYAVEKAFEDRSHVTVFDRESAYHVDVKLALSPEERAEVEAAVVVPFEGGDLRIAPPEEVVAWKLKFGSPQDLLDARSILVRQGDDLDVDRLVLLAGRLGVEKALERLMAEVRGPRD